MNITGRSKVNAYSNESPEKFKEYIFKLTEFCQKNNVIMLRTIGVVFSDDEKRITQYMK
jgi:hypothetical protein